MKSELAEFRRRQDLATFLQAKRAALAPKDVGIVSIGRRRAPGLRREELAQIAGIGVTWYTWLEQGRDINVSFDLLQRLTQALRLSPHDSAYLFSLAGHPLTPPPEHDRTLIEGLQTVLDGYRWGPALVMDAIGTTIAYNEIGDVLYHYKGYEGPWGDNIFWRLFMCPYRRQLYLNWSELALFAVGLMRGFYASRKNDVMFHDMIEDLCMKCPEFRRMWDESAPQGVNSIAPSPLHLQVAGIGELRFLSVRLLTPSHGGITMFGSPSDQATKDAMRRLAESLSSDDL